MLRCDAGGGASISPPTVWKGALGDAAFVRAMVDAHSTLATAQTDAGAGSERAGLVELSPIELKVLRSFAAELELEAAIIVEEELGRPCVTEDVCEGRASNSSDWPSVQLSASPSRAPVLTSTASSTEPTPEGVESGYSGLSRLCSVRLHRSLRALCSEYSCGGNTPQLDKFLRSAPVV